MLQKCIKKSGNLFFTSTDNLKVLFLIFLFWFIRKTILVPFCSKFVLITTSRIEKESSIYHFFPRFYIAKAPEKDPEVCETLL